MDPKTDGTEVPMLTFPEHESHNHCLYGLDCLQFEALLAACGQCCQCCGGKSGTVGGRKLVIDHDHQIGDWAVRGMLCSGCNTQIRNDTAIPEWAQPYLNDPWWPRLLAECGVEAEMPEPAERRVADFFGRLWFHGREGWSTGRYLRGVLDEIPWAALLRKYGPHNLTPVPNAAIVPNMSIQSRMREGVLRGGKQ